jgi:crossover junction endodeoxyribonuclease RusA
VSWSLSLPFPPSTNNLFAQAGKKRISSARASAYARTVFAAVLASGASRGLAGELRAVLAVWSPDLRRRDLDNLCKAPLDGLVKAGVMADDSQVVDLRIYRAGIDRKNPRITVWLEAA